jgi:fatty acid desaturase
MLGADQDSAGGLVAGNAGGGHGASMGSWIACLVIIVGFAVGGIALIYWNWPVFWVGVGIVVVGCVIARAVNIMEDVTEYGGSAST